ncbi:hypothetical protein MAP00_000314 [Monascus purpureus]|nr:hypothetical protein MAP00_000314 [Monascus purpureus]
MGSDIEKARKGREHSHFEPRANHSSAFSSGRMFIREDEVKEEGDESTINSHMLNQCTNTHLHLQTHLANAHAKPQSKFNLILDLRRRITKCIRIIRSWEETRGIDPIPLNERRGVGNQNNGNGDGNRPGHGNDGGSNNSSNGDDGMNIPFQMMLLWFSMTLATNNIIIGSLGTLVFQLGFAEAALCAVFGTILGGIGVGYMSIWGPKSGSRTLIVTRFFMGYYPSKICALLNILTNLGYSMLNCILGGQLLSKVSGGNVSVVIGIILVAVASWILATFGIRLFQFYERYSWLPQLIVLSIITGSSVSLFNFNKPLPRPQPPGTLNARCLTFFSLCLSASLAWAPIAADYYVYYPPSISTWKTFLMTLLGQTQAMIATLTLGIGLGTVISSNESWKLHYDSTPGSLLMAAYNSLGGVVGKFCAILNVVGVISNNAPGAYSMGLNFQMLGRRWDRVPRSVFAFGTTVAYTACALGGRGVLYEVFKNFLPLIGYWVVVWIVVVVEEDVLFRRPWSCRYRLRFRSGGDGHWHFQQDRNNVQHDNRDYDYDWSSWNQKDKLPVGVAATLAFLAGWVGAIVGMVCPLYLSFLYILFFCI